METENFQLPKKKSKEDEASIFDASKLSKYSLRKYKFFFKLDCDDETLTDKVQNHFVNELSADPNIILDKILKLKKEDRNDLLNCKRPSTRKNPKFI